MWFRIYFFLLLLRHFFLRWSPPELAADRLDEVKLQPETLKSNLRQTLSGCSWLATCGFPLSLSLPLFSFFVVGLNPLPGPRGEWTSLFNIFRPTSPAEGGSCRAASSIKPPAGRSLWRNSRRFGGNFAEFSDWRKLGGKFWTQTALFFLNYLTYFFASHLTSSLIYPVNPLHTAARLYSNPTFLLPLLLFDLIYCAVNHRSARRGVVVVAEPPWTVPIKAHNLIDKPAHVNL